ncbi:hypothetical protein [Deinococcus sp. 6GRE01]|uniref:hypothetical protein n=1 Tax=Deinococcus sp. 6GRE01 TaxID=2745873 RepID=UPI001E4E1F42|nr:hypothetical protein [Deinococcus sp. 6GRE01]MCD0155828.1 hypothetical protein [Deinococcus sp. 6GRE01]
MTVIAALAHDGQVFMASDNVATGNRAYQVTNSKIHQNGPLLIGLSGSVVVSDIIEHGWTPPSRAHGESAERFLAWTVSRSLRTLLREQAHVSTDRDGEYVNLNALIGYEGRLYYLSTEFSVLSLTAPFEAIGCGSDYAMGVLYAYSRMDGAARPSPEEQLTRAVEAACQFDVHCAPPIHHHASPRSGT